MMNFVFTLRNDGYYRVGTNKREDGNGFEGECHTSIQIPNEYNGSLVVEIGVFSFRNTSQLEEVTLPSFLTIINSNAFDQCSLRSINFPESLQYIGSYSFAMNNLENVVIPKNVNFIGTDPFGHNPKLSSISVDQGNHYYATDICGSLLNKQQTIFIQALSTSSKVIVPPTVHTILSQAFDNTVLTELIITGNIKTFGTPAFQSLPHLSTIIYYGYKRIPENAFASTKPIAITVCNDYIDDTLLDITLTKSGYCYRRFSQEKNVRYFSSFPFIATFIISFC